MHDRDSFYYRAIRTKLGDALKAQYDLKQPLPEPLAKALLELDRQELDRQLVGALQELMSREDDRDVRERARQMLHSIKASAETY